MTEEYSGDCFKDAVRLMECPNCHASQGEECKETNGYVHFERMIALHEEHPKSIEKYWKEMEEKS
jgi:uncharacterized protein YggL (DUF469 family)